MNGFLASIREKLRRLLAGRYGPDELTIVLDGAALVLFLLGLLLRNGTFTLLAFAAMIWAIYRVMSRKFDKRSRELQIWYGIKSRLTDEYKLLKSRWQDRKTHVYFRCACCRTALRVPKGKGSIRVTCPRCGNTVTKRT